MKHSAILMMTLLPALIPAGARAEETSRYHMLLETLVFTGLAEPGTVNANIEVYRSILGSVVRDAGIAERAHTPAQARVPRVRMVRALQDLKRRLSAQMPLLPEEVTELLAGEVATSLATAGKAAVQGQYGVVKALALRAGRELEKARVE